MTVALQELRGAGWRAEFRNAYSTMRKLQSQAGRAGALVHCAQAVRSSHARANVTEARPKGSDSGGVQPGPAACWRDGRGSGLRSLARSLFCLESGVIYSPAIRIFNMHVATSGALIRHKVSDVSTCMSEQAISLTAWARISRNNYPCRHSGPGFALNLPFNVTLIEIGNRFFDLGVAIRLCPNRELGDNVPLLVGYDSQERKIVVRYDPHGGVIIGDWDNSARVTAMIAPVMICAKHTGCEHAWG